jgi:hypothetical protein
MFYVVNLWGSHPEHVEDDLWYGEDFGSHEEALKAFENPKKHFGFLFEGTKYVEMKGCEAGGVEVYEVKEVYAPCGEDEGIDPLY